MRFQMLQRFHHPRTISLFEVQTASERAPVPLREERRVQM